MTGAVPPSGGFLEKLYGDVAKGWLDYASAPKKSNLRGAGHDEFVYDRHRAMRSLTSHLDGPHSLSRVPHLRAGQEK